ncbi:MAG: carbohydrate ABC transporter permease [Anaerolineae bacterium]|nr:carbohydrate ABC transporter permease [Anaerolineae bacterium]
MAAMTSRDSYSPAGRTPRRVRFNAKFVAIYASLSLVSVFTIFCLLWILSVSLKGNQEFLMNPPWSLPESPNLDNYVNAWNGGLANMYANSLFVAVLGTGFSVILSTLAAYPLARIPFRWNLNQLVLTIFLLGMMIPYILTSIPLYFFLNKYTVGGVDPRIILVVLYAVSGFPFNTFVMVTTFKTLPSELEEAAAIDGASPFTTFWRIMLPLSTPGLATVTIINFLSLWNEFYYGLIFITDKTKYTVALGLVMLDNKALYAAKWPPVFAGAILAILPVLIVFAVLQDRVTKGLTAGAIKG